MERSAFDVGLSVVNEIVKGHGGGISAPFPASILRSFLPNLLKNNDNVLAETNDQGRKIQSQGR
jgi:hypothetical protein